MTDPNSTAVEESTLRDRVLYTAKHGEATDLLEIWKDVCAAPPEDADFYNQLIRARATTYDPEAVRMLLTQLVAAAEAREDWQVILRIVDAAATMWPDSEEFRNAVVLALSAKYEDHPNVSEILRVSKIEQGAPIDQALKRFRALLKFSPGRAYEHATWGVGVIKSLDLTEGKVSLDFPNEKGRVLTLAGVRDFLNYLPPSHFLAQRATEPERLMALAEESPVELIKLVLESNKGRMKQSELKVQIINGVVSEKAWNTWWTKARGELRMDPLVDFDAKGGAHAEIILRSKPKTFEEEVQDLFLGPDADLAGRINAVKHLQNSQGGAAGKTPSPELVNRMLKALSEDYEKTARQMSSTDRLQCALLAEDLRELAGSAVKNEATALPAATGLLEDFDDSYSELADMEHPDHAQRALRLLMERHGDRGFELAAKLFPKAPSKLAQVIWKALDPEHHNDIAIHAVQGLFERPLENPQTYLWAVKQMIDGSWKHMESYFPATWLVQELLDGMDTWEKMMDRPSVDKATQATAKLLLSRTKSLFETDRFSLLCTAVEQMSLDQARRLRRTIQGHSALAEAYRHAAERQLILTKRELLEEKPTGAAGIAAAVQASADALHYCTERARELKLRELNELNTVRIPANSKEIEKARSEGDLKENAGYIYAKEQQKLLMQASLQLQQALQTARIFDKSKVSTTVIGFGTACEVENLKKKRIEKYTVLGRFETDPDRNIVSYQSPFMAQFVGKKPGEDVLIKHPDGGETPYRVRSISNALESREWDAPELA
ncbi:MAG: GreA/GreB family elongation factor [Candidatus Sumerlaeaceae bacterium]